MRPNVIQTVYEVPATWEPGQYVLVGYRPKGVEIKARAALVRRDVYTNGYLDKRPAWRVRLMGSEDFLIPMSVLAAELSPTAAKAMRGKMLSAWIETDRKWNRVRLTRLLESEDEVRTALKKSNLQSDGVVIGPWFGNTD